MPTKRPAAAPPPPTQKKSKLKIVLIVGIAALLLTAGGLGLGLYAGHAFPRSGPKEDPLRPKLVERGENDSEPADGEGGEKAPAPKVGTVSVKSDAVVVDPRRFEVTYVPLDQPFTANLANGGIIQVGLSFATYYDHRVVENVQRQTVPIRSAALMVLSDEDPAILATPAGKQELQRELTKAVNQVLREKEGFGGIDNVYFTSLVIQ
ncbi:MAG TPA: flagellar basal body-associated FliL family protein [Sphingomicrobium sp.]|nr:flagellar basal body-associated FliL family protein [Sphingomicrobium sp.]